MPPSPEPSGDGILVIQWKQGRRTRGLGATLRLIARAFGSVRGFSRPRLRNSLQFTRTGRIEVIQGHLELVVGQLRRHIPISQLRWEVGGQGCTICTIDGLVITLEM